MIDHTSIRLFEIIACIFAGLSIGSFITLASYRLPLDKDIVMNRSHCINCKNKLNIYDLVPLFSWLIQAGKCRYCKTKINFRYPLIESLTAYLIYLIYIKYGLSYYCILISLIAICLIILIITDLEHYMIPDQIQITLAVLAIVYNFYHDNVNFSPLISSVIACSVGIIIRKFVYIIKNQDPLGFGDIKFLAVSGLYLPYEVLPLYLFISGLIGILTAFAWKIIDKGNVFPFGPALAISFFMIINFPEVKKTFDNIIIKLIYSLGIIT